MNNEVLDIAVIGTGKMGKNHIRILSTNPCFNLVGIYDINTAAANEVAKIYNTVAFTNLDELLSKVKAAIVVVPSSLHKEIAIKVANAGVNAFVEKPLATNSIDAIEIVNTFKEKKLKLQVGHIERFNTVFIELNKLLKPSDIFYIEIHRYSPFSGSGRISDVSVVEDLLIHDVDLASQIMNGVNISSIKSFGEIIKSDKLDFVTCVLTFENNAHAVINSSRVSQYKERTITVHAKDAVYFVDLVAKTLTVYKDTNLKIDIDKNSSFIEDSVIQKIHVPNEEPLRLELLSFYNAIINDESIIVDGSVATNAIKICEKVLEGVNHG